MRRRPLFLFALLVAASIDVARSLHTRVVAARPAAAAAITTAAARADSGASPGRQLYVAQCARCHGAEGKGDGPAASALRPRPRDFTRGIFKLKSTASGEPPTLGDVRATIRRGMPGTSMPGFHDLLSEAEVDAVAEEIRRFGPHAGWGAEDPALKAAEGEGRAEHGAKLFVDLGCPVCHAKDGRGDGAAATALKDVWMQPAPPRDLTAPWSFRGGATRAATYRATARGLSGTPMPGYLDAGSPQDLLDVVAYISSIARTPAWADGGQLDQADNGGSPVKRGEYLVRTGMCALCHSPLDADGVARRELAGGVQIDVAAHGIYFGSNLTADADSGIGNRKIEEIALAIQSGHTRWGRLNFLAMPWVIYGSLPAADALAIATYLKSVPAVRRVVPRPLHYGFVETVLRKLTYSWPGALPPRVTYGPTYLGHEPRERWDSARVQDLLVWIQLAALLAAIVSLFRVPADGGEGGRSSAVLVASIICAAVFGAAALVVYWYPALNALPGKPLVDAFAAAVPQVREEGRTPGQIGLLQRGRYLYLTSSCAYCHNGNGSGGGKVNERSGGTVWAANLTNDPSGLAGRSDELVLRALVSGITAGGRAIDPLAMPWDRYASLSPEDQHALLAFLRTLPAIENAVPEAQPGGADNGDGVTFWTRR